MLGAKLRSRWIIQRAFSRAQINLKHITNCNKAGDRLHKQRHCGLNTPAQVAWQCNITDQNWPEQARGRSVFPSPAPVLQSGLNAPPN